MFVRQIFSFFSLFFRCMDGYLSISKHLLKPKYSEIDRIAKTKRPVETSNLRYLVYHCNTVTSVYDEKNILKFMLSNEPSTNFCVTLRNRYKLWGLSTLCLGIIIKLEFLLAIFTDKRLHKPHYTHYIININHQTGNWNENPSASKREGSIFSTKLISQLTSPFLSNYLF